MILFNILLIFVAISGAALAQDAPPAPSTSAPSIQVPEGMILVPAGEFWMGTDDADRSDNNQRDNVPLTANDARPRHRASTSAFFLDKTEVTNAQYKKFCDATGYLTPPDWTNGAFPEGKAEVPVTRVNWYEASAYAAWAGKRLPTETEWEHAARGDDGRLYPWGNGWDQSRVVWDTDGPIAVGSRPGGASVYGALDLSGNVMEWTSSWFDAYPGTPTPQPDFGTKLKVVRGGAWMGGQILAATWHRAVNRPQSRTEWIGFRCAQDVR